MGGSRICPGEYRYEAASASTDATAASDRVITRQLAERVAPCGVSSLGVILGLSPPPPRLHYALLYNPIAGRGAASRVARTIHELLVDLGQTVTEGPSERAGHIEEMSAQLGREVDRVLVLGGDGSLREAAAGLLSLPVDERAELGVLPFGSGNVVARELGLPLDPVAAGREIVSAKAGPFDVAYAAFEDRPREVFLAMAGVGYDASIAAGIARARATKFGAGWYRRSADSLYGLLATREMLRLSCPRMSISVDGEPVQARAVAAIVSNVETYAKGMAMSPGARADDGRLDLHVRHSRWPWATLTAHLQAQRRRPSPHWAARLYSGETAVLEAASDGAPFFLQLDGDALGLVRRVELSVERGALAIVGMADRNAHEVDQSAQAVE